jgi:hypothetical protein
LPENVGTLSGVAYCRIAEGTKQATNATCRMTMVDVEAIALDLW